MLPTMRQNLVWCITVGLHNMSTRTIAILTEDDLKEASGYKDRAQIRAWLARNRIPFTTGNRGRLSTSIDAFNQALGIAPGAATESVKIDEYEVL